MQEASLECLKIVVATLRGALGDDLGVFVGRITRGFLGPVAIRIWVVTIRIVIVGRTGIHGIQNHTEDAALHAAEQVARAREGFLRGLAASYNEKKAVGLHRKD